MLTITLCQVLLEPGWGVRAHVLCQHNKVSKRLFQLLEMTCNHCKPNLEVSSRLSLKFPG